MQEIQETSPESFIAKNHIGLQNIYIKNIHFFR